MWFPTPAAPNALSPNHTHCFHCHSSYKPEHRHNTNTYSAGGNTVFIHFSISKVRWWLCTTTVQLQCIEELIISNGTWLFHAGLHSACCQKMLPFVPRSVFCFRGYIWFLWPQLTIHWCKHTINHQFAYHCCVLLGHVLLLRFSSQLLAKSLWVVKHHFFTPNSNYQVLPIWSQIQPAKS